MPGQDDMHVEAYGTVTPPQPQELIVDEDKDVSEDEEE